MTYVLADLHGYYDKYSEMLEKSNSALQTHSTFSAISLTVVRTESGF